MLLSSNSSLALPFYLLIYFPLPKIKPRLSSSAFLLSPVRLTPASSHWGSLSLCLVLFLVKCFQSPINLWKKLLELLDFSLSGFHLYPFKYIFLFSVWDQSVLGISSEKILSLELFVISKSVLNFFKKESLWHGILLIFSLRIFWNLLSQSQGHIPICPANIIIKIIGKADVWENKKVSGTYQFAYLVGKGSTCLPV